MKVAQQVKFMRMMAKKVASALAEPSMNYG
jgi:hypothetical protein